MPHGNRWIHRSFHPRFSSYSRRDAARQLDENFRNATNRGRAWKKVSALVPNCDRFVGIAESTGSRSIIDMGNNIEVVTIECRSVLDKFQVLI